MASDEKLDPGFYVATFGGLDRSTIDRVADRPLKKLVAVLGDGKTIDFKVERGMLYLNTPDGMLIVRPAVTNAIHVEVETHYETAIKRRG